MPLASGPIFVNAHSRRTTPPMPCPEFAARGPQRAGHSPSRALPPDGRTGSARPSGNSSRLRLHVDRVGGGEDQAPPRSSFRAVALNGAKRCAYPQVDHRIRLPRRRGRQCAEEHALPRPQPLTNEGTHDSSTSTTSPAAIDASACARGTVKRWPAPYNLGEVTTVSCTSSSTW